MTDVFALYATIQLSQLDKRWQSFFPSQLANLIFFSPDWRFFFLPLSSKLLHKLINNTPSLIDWQITFLSFFSFDPTIIEPRSLLLLHCLAACISQNRIIIELHQASTNQSFVIEFVRIIATLYNSDSSSQSQIPTPGSSPQLSISRSANIATLLKDLIPYFFGQDVNNEKG